MSCCPFDNSTNYFHASELSKKTHFFHQTPIDQLELSFLILELIVIFENPK